MRSSRFVSLILVLVLGVAPACGDGESSKESPSTVENTPSTLAEPAPASTSSVESVTLRIGTNDPPDQATAAVIEEFARTVDEISGGALRVEPVFRAAGDPAPDDWDQAVARMVVNGDLDMGLIPSAAWDTEGVMTLRALNAPFLVDSDELVEAIVTSDLADELLSGLDEVGITGLALLPEGLRHVFAFGEPLLTPSDFAGVTIRAPRSATVYALFQALGAIVDDPQGSDFDAAVAAGALGGAESSYARANSLPGRLTATGNVTLFPKVNSLVVNSAAFQALDGAQQAVLRDAAEQTSAYVLANVTVDTVSAQEYCTKIGSLVLATDADLTALAEAAEPVYDALQQHVVTKGLIERIREIKATMPVPPAFAPCEKAGPPPPADPSNSVSSTIPNGMYTRVATLTASVDRGLDPAIVDEVLGPDGEITIVLEIADGRWTQYETLDNGDNQVGDLGTYTYDSAGHWVTESTSGGCRGCTAVLDWTFIDDVLSLAFAPAEDGRARDDIERLMVEGDYTVKE